ncbi:MAG: caspase family protein [Chloroflexota bacterium]|nr:caspase family protein [Chloroflexota bacterium]
MSGLFAHGYALLIGIGAYRHLRRLDKPATDARDLYDALVNSDGCGYPPAQIASLLNEQATKGAISDKLDWLARRAGPDDTVLIFFSGHGAQRIGGFEPGEYLCPVEADWYNLRASAISNDELTRALRAIRARKAAVFLDACHSGGVGEPRDASIQVKAGLSEQTYDQLSAGEGRVVIASCRPGEDSWELEGMRNGLFTHHLLKGLRGEGMKVEGETIDVLDLFRYLSQAVPADAQTAGVAQTPLLKAHDVTSFPIALVTSVRKPRPRPPVAAPLSLPQDPTFKQLLYFARRGQCRLFIGDGVSSEAGMPGVEALWDTLRAELGEMGLSVPANAPLTEIATALEKAAGRTELIGMLQRVFDDALRDHPWERGAYPWIARLPVGLTEVIYTSNWDDALKRAFEETGHSTREVRHPAELALIPRAGHAIVKLRRDFHGPDGPLVSESDYAVALRDIEQGTAGTLWGHLAGQLAQYRFAFVGYDLGDPTLNLIRRAVEMHTGTLGERRHFLVGPMSPEEAQAAERWAGVRPVVAGASDFFQALVREMEGEDDE